MSKNEFWGDYVIPTISRDNPAFKDQQYWRGTIWPPTNYLVYQGLKRYREDLLAAEFAGKSARLFMKSWNTFGLCRENYNSITGEGGGQKYQSWGPLFALILLEDFIDYSPYDGFRIGNLSANQENTIKNIKIQNHSYTLKVNQRNLSLYRDGEKIIAFNGRAVLRQLKISADSISFEAHTYDKGIELFPFVFAGRRFDINFKGKRASQKGSHIKIKAGESIVHLKVTN